MAILQPVTLATGATRTDSGSGSAVDCSTPGRSAGISLDVTATLGGTLLVVIETSATGLDGDWETVATFPEVAGVTSVRLAFGELLRYIRTSWTISGTSPSFTFSVSGRVYAHLITRKQLDDHLSPRAVARLLDDHGSGSASEDAVNSLLAYASSMMRGKLGTVDDLAGFSPETQSEVVRIGLDICQARCAIRHPEVLRMDGVKLLESAKKDLRDIVVNGASLGVPERPPVEAYTGGVVSGTPRGW